MTKLSLPLRMGLLIFLLAGVTLAAYALARLVYAHQSQYKMVLGYEGQARYLAALQADPAADPDALYQQYVTSVYQADCGGGGLMSLNPYVSFTDKHPLGNLDLFAGNIRALQAANTAQIAQKTFRQSQKLLPGSQVTLCIFASDPFQDSPILYYMHGVWGATYGPGVFWIEIADKVDWQNWLPYTIAHEYQHTVFFKDYPLDPSHPADLLEAMVGEGRADSFAHLLYPQVEGPWLHFLTPAQEALVWQSAQSELTSTDVAVFTRFLFGDAEIPYDAGYTIGYHIVQKYLQSHPQTSVKEWTQMDARQLFAESGYTGQP